MKAILFTAYRYLFLKNNAQAINILSFITMLAMACGAGALVVILSTFNGFESLSKDLNESFQADLTIMPSKNKFFEVSDKQWEALRNDENVIAASQTLKEKVYLKYENSETIATLKGVDENYFQTNDLKDYLLVGDTTLETENSTYAIAGVSIANKLSINPDIALEPISVYFPKSETLGSLNINDNFELGYLRLGGVFSIYQEYDENYVLCPIGFIRYLQGSDDHTVSSIEIKIKEGKENAVRNTISKAFDNTIEVKNKLQLDESFYKISRIEKIIVFLILTFILIILSFNFIGSLTMHTIEKSRDIKVLHALGFTQKNIFSLYLSIGMLQGMLGGIIGVLIGIIICALQFYFGFVKLPGSGTFVIDSYPVMIKAEDIFTILVILFVISFLASLWPAIRARKIITSAL